MRAVFHVRARVIRDPTCRSAPLNFHFQANLSTPWDAETYERNRVKWRRERPFALSAVNAHDERTSANQKSTVPQRQNARLTKLFGFAILCSLRQRRKLMNRIPSGSGNATFGRPPTTPSRTAHPVGAALRPADPVVNMQGPGAAIAGAPVAVPQADLCE